MALPWNRLTLTVGATYRVRCEPGWKLDTGWSQRLLDYDFWLVWAGRGWMTLRGGRRLALEPGTCLWMRPGGLYLADQDLGDRLGVSAVHFDLRDSRGKRPSDAALPPAVHELVDYPYAEAVCRRVMDLMRRAGAGRGKSAAAQRGAAATLLTGVLMDLDAGGGERGNAGGALTPTERTQRQTMLNQAAAITADPAAAPPVAELAREAGYSPDHYGRVFRKVTGVSPQDHLIQARIARARSLLLETAMTISEIADALGYGDVYFFSRQFKQKVGVSPTTYRRRAAR